MTQPAVTHHPGCSPHYPEKIPGEPPHLLVKSHLDGYEEDVWVCVDCGAFVVVPCVCAAPCSTGLSPDSHGKPGDGATPTKKG